MRGNILSPSPYDSSLAFVILDDQLILNVEKRKNLILQLIF